MESSGHQSSISTLKVEFHCSKDCPRDVKKRLQDLAGVESVCIDVKQGLVTVKGKVNNPMELVNLINEKTGGKKELAQLWSFQRTPLQDQQGCHRHCHHHSDSVSDSSCETQSDRRKHPQWKNDHKKSNKHRYRFGWGHHNYNYAKPVSFAAAAAAAPPPPPPPMRFYWPPPLVNVPPSTLMPSSCVNPMTHYTSYADNYFNYR